MSTSASTPDFDPDDFEGDEIDNPNLPMEEGSVWVYSTEGSLDFVWVTDQTKEIAGVETTVVHDVAFEDGALVEATSDFFAQDDDGNVWYFGENTAEFANGHPTTFEGSWRAGFHGAEPGIIMQAHPKVGQTYSEENAPGIAEDKATVISLDASVDVPIGSFDHVLQTHNFTPLDPTNLETKYYAKGVGNILTIDETTGEREELVFFHEGDDRDGADCGHDEGAAHFHHFHDVGDLFA
jgi:hypothetical protein